MRRFTSSLSYGGDAAIGPSPGPAGTGLAPRSILRLFGDHGVTSFTLQDLGQVAFLVDGKHHDRDSVLARERNRRRIHDLQVPGQYLMIGEKIIAFGVFDAFGIGAV